MRTQKNMEKKVESSSDTVARRKKRLWTLDEDNKLVEYVKKYGERNWSNVQRVTGLTRTGKSCRLRWRDQLHPDLNKQPFTIEEEKLIGDLQSQVGNKWSVIADFMPGRTDNAIKNYWYNRCKRYRITALPNEQVTSSSETGNSGFKVNEPDLSPEWISNSELSRLHHLPSTGVLNPEGFELSSIQHVETPRGFSYKSGLPLLPLESFHAMCNFYSPATNMLCFKEQTYGLDLVSTVSSFGPISTDRELIVEQSDGYTFTDCNNALVDPLLTDGDIVDMWLNESRDQGSVCREALCVDSGAIGDISAATTTADDINVLPAWLNSPGLDEFLDQEPISQHTLIAEYGAVNNVVAATEEPSSCFNSSAPNEFLGQESISETVGCENGGTMIDAASVNEPPYWFNSPETDDFLIQEPIFPDAVFCADYGVTDDFAAS